MELSRKAKLKNNMENVSTGKIGKRELNGRKRSNKGTSLNSRKNRGFGRMLALGKNNDEL